MKKLCPQCLEVRVRKNCYACARCKKLNKIWDGPRHLQYRREIKVR